jgi:hypothetical protein
MYLSGGPATPSWVCPRVFPPGAGTITVIDPATGATVASATVAQGQLATIPLAPGTYTIEGTDADAAREPGDMPLKTGPQTVTIPAG